MHVDIIRTVKTLLEFIYKILMKKQLNCFSELNCSSENKHRGYIRVCSTVILLILYF